jgi:hypothetical protein
MTSIILLVRLAEVRTVNRDLEYELHNLNRALESRIQEARQHTKSMSQPMMEVQPFPHPYM